jgi:hypothetical protein
MPYNFATEFEHLLNEFACIVYDIIESVATWLDDGVHPVQRVAANFETGRADGRPVSMHEGRGPWVDTIVLVFATDRIA